jgi:glucose-6-phosphate dehydrogenase assembly protein OpcA
MSEVIPTEGLGKPVEVGAIDGELKKLWEADEASTNASLMNFLVYTEDPQRLLKNSEMIQELTREHACRAVLIAMNRKATEVKVESWITAHCHLAHGKKSICSEQIAFLLHGKSLGRLRNTVFAHLNSDLPLVFWWQGELSDLFEERLYRLLNRLIFDSATWSDPLKGFRRIAEAREDTKGQMVTQDLSWTRSYFYRLAVARLFDDPIAQRSFPEIDEVKLKGNPKSRIAVLLFLAWISTRSGWTPEDCRGDSWTLRSREGVKISVDFEWDEEAAPIAGLALRAPGCEVKVEREANCDHLCQSVSAVEHRVISRGPADADEPEGLVASQLSRGGKNTLFLTVWPQFLEMLERSR